MVEMRNCRQRSKAIKDGMMMFVTQYGSTMYRDCSIWFLYSPHTLGNSVLVFSFKVNSTSDDFTA